MTKARNLRLYFAACIAAIVFFYAGSAGTAATEGLTVENSTPDRVLVELYPTKSAGGAASAIATLSPNGGRATWALSGPRAIKVERINADARDKHGWTICRAKAQTNGEPGEWEIAIELTGRNQVKTCVLHRR